MAQHGLGWSNSVELFIPGCTTDMVNALPFQVVTFLAQRGHVEREQRKKIPLILVYYLGI